MGACEQTGEGGGATERRGLERDEQSLRKGDNTSPHIVAVGSQLSQYGYNTHTHKLARLGKMSSGDTAAS